MKFQEVRAIGKARGINTFQMGKTEVIRAIQQAEDSIVCYNTPRVEYCGELACLWREDCLLQVGNCKRGE